MQRRAGRRGLLSERERRCLRLCCNGTEIENDEAAGSMERTPGAEKNEKAIDRILGVRESSIPMMVQKGGSLIMRWFLRAALVVVVAQLFSAGSAFGFHLDPSQDPETLLAPEPPFVICKN